MTNPIHTYEVTDPNTGIIYRTTTKLRKQAATIFTDAEGNSKVGWFKDEKSALADVARWGTVLGTAFTEEDPAKLEELTTAYSAATGDVKINSTWGVSKLAQELEAIEEREARNHRQKLKEELEAAVKAARREARGTMEEFCDAMGGQTVGSPEYHFRSALRWLRVQKSDWEINLRTFIRSAEDDPVRAVDRMFPVMNKNVALVEVHDNVQAMFNNGWHRDEIAAEVTRTVSGYLRVQSLNKAAAWWAFQDMLSNRF